jgi:ribosomal protein S18 acetylase RimI-like enzyme
MEAQIRRILLDFARRKAGNEPLSLHIRGVDPWDVQISLHLPGWQDLLIRSLRRGDLAHLQAFSQDLGAVSKDLFCPYPWRGGAALNKAFRRAIGQVCDRVDASYLIFARGKPVAHFILWKAGGNPSSQPHGLAVPVLGVAVADAYQRRGLGGVAVRVLQVVARSLQADGVELTTAQRNEVAWNTYLGAGFEYLGILRIPLEVDVAAAEAGQVTASRYRDERQMLYVINPASRDAILRYLMAKRIAGASRVERASGVCPSL